MSDLNTAHKRKDKFRLYHIVDDDFAMKLQKSLTKKNTNAYLL